jgi:hypothetical protein
LPETTTPFDLPYPNAVRRFPKLRQSTLSSFDNCGLSAAFDADYRKGWNTTPQGRGTLFHKVAAECLRAMALVGEDTIPVDAAHGILNDVLRQADADKECPTCKTEEILPGVDGSGRRTCANGHKFVTSLVNCPTEAVKDLYWVVIKWANDTAFNIKDLAAVELRLEAEIRYTSPHGGSVPRILSGQLDALFVEGLRAEHAVVIDWKDMWALPADRGEGVDDEVSFKGYFQQRFYAWLIFANFPSVQKVTLRERYVRFGESREASVDRKMEAEIEAELAALAERFDRAFDTKPATVTPTPGKHCGYCLRPNACPIPRFAREEGRVIDEAEAIKLAGELIVADEVLKRTRKDLRAYAERNGPIPVKDAKGMRAMGYVPQTRTKRPDLATIERAEQEKGAPLTVAEIGKLYKTTHGTRFQSYTPDEVDEAASDAEIEEKLMASIKAAQEAQRHLHVVPDPVDEKDVA